VKKTVKDKVDQVNAVLPQLSEQGQDYLLGIAQAMNLIEKPAVYADGKPFEAPGLAGNNIVGGR
jgi:hypothetical protein